MFSKIYFNKPTDLFKNIHYYIAFVVIFLKNYKRIFIRLQIFIRNDATSRFLKNIKYQELIIENNLSYDCSWYRVSFSSHSATSVNLFQFFFWIFEIAALHITVTWTWCSSSLSAPDVAQFISFRFSQAKEINWLTLIWKTEEATFAAASRHRQLQEMGKVKSNATGYKCLDRQSHAHWPRQFPPGGWFPFLFPFRIIFIYGICTMKMEAGTRVFQVPQEEMHSQWKRESSESCLQHALSLPCCTCYPAARRRMQTELW